MTYQTKRELREEITQLKAALHACREKDGESVQRMRDTIRVLNLTAYIKHQQHGWGQEVYYNVNQFLEDVEIAAKHLGDAAAQEGYIEAIDRLKNLKKTNDEENAA